MPSDSELLDGFEALLRKDDAIFEFVFDRRAGIVFAGEAGGDTLREALAKLLEPADA